MAEILVEIHSDGPHYPRGNVVHHNDKVIFSLVGIQGDVEVTPDTPCCFTSSSPFTLNANSSLVPATHEETVSSTATQGPYYFTADVPPTTPPERRPPNWEAKRGEVDVSTDTGKD